jgi:hypothetical protein
MQRCPYLHEMKERLLGPIPVRQETLTMESFDREQDNLLPPSSRQGSNQVGTVVKVRLWYSYVVYNQIGTRAT